MNWSSEQWTEICVSSSCPWPWWCRYPAEARALHLELSTHIWSRKRGAWRRIQGKVGRLQSNVTGMLNCFTFIMMIKRDKCRPGHKTKAERREAAVILRIITGICHPCLEKGIISFSKDCFLCFRASSSAFCLSSMLSLFTQQQIHDEYVFH